MSTHTDDLESLGEAELHELCAVELDGWSTRPLNDITGTFICNILVPPSGSTIDRKLPDYCNDARPLLRHLSTRHWNAWTQGDSKEVYVGIYPDRGERGYNPSHAATFELAAVLALLRHKRQSKSQ